MLQLGALILVDRARVAEADREVHHATARGVDVRAGVDRQAPAAVRHHAEAASCGVEGLHSRDHPIHEVVLFVLVAGQDNAQPNIDGQVRRQRRPVGSQLVLRVVVLRVLLVVRGNDRLGALVAVREKHLHGVLI